MCIISHSHCKLCLVIVSINLYLSHLPPFSRFYFTAHHNSLSLFLFSFLWKGLGVWFPPAQDHLTQLPLSKWPNVKNCPYALRIWPTFSPPPLDLPGFAGFLSWDFPCPLCLRKWTQSKSAWDKTTSRGAQDRFFINVFWINPRPAQMIWANT